MMNEQWAEQLRELSKSFKSIYHGLSETFKYFLMAFEQSKKPKLPRKKKKLYKKLGLYEQWKEDNL